MFFVASRGHHADIGGSAPGIVSSFHYMLSSLKELVITNLFEEHLVWGRGVIEDTTYPEHYQKNCICFKI